MLCNLKRLFAATLVLALCAGVAQAGEETAAAKTGAASGQVATAGRGDEASPAAAASAPRAAQAATPAKPRRPDTAGWRRIMAGAGRT